MADQFFLSRNGKVTGPVSSNAIKKGIFSGKLLTTDYISTAATGPWKPIGDIPPPAPVSPRISPSRNRHQSPSNANRNVIHVCLGLGLLLGVVVVGIVVYQWEQPSVRLTDSREETRTQQPSNPDTQGGGVDSKLKDLGATIKLNQQFEIMVVYLNHTQITDVGLAHLAGLTSLQELHLNYTQITDAGLAHLSGLTSLQELDLYGTQISDAGLVHLEGLTSLQTLHLNYTQITDAGLVHLEGLTSLQELDLATTQITNRGLVHLVGLTSLERLRLGGTQITDAGVAKLKEALPNCDIEHF